MTAYSLAVAALPIQTSGRSGGDEYAAAELKADSSVRDDRSSVQCADNEYSSARLYAVIGCKLKHCNKC